MKLKSIINNLIADAFNKSAIEIESPVVTESTKTEFGDYQFNGIMSLAKKLHRNPKEIALEVAGHIKIGEEIAKVEVAGPGFINIWLSNAWLSNQAKLMLQDTNLGIIPKSNPQRVVVDYSGPNMAKQMHVGHLRSTIIGDTLANLFEYLGDSVIRQNHIGDWGTQFGMLIAYLEEIGIEKANSDLQDLEQFYKDAKKRFDSDRSFANKAREYVVKLQSGDSHCLMLWKNFIDTSLGHCEEIYEKLFVALVREDVRAESSYNDKLPQVIEHIKNIGKLQTSEGAKCYFFDEEEIPVILQKKDGGYLYATTDLAALWHRSEELKADRICYVVDARQSEHFRQIFRLAKESGLVKPELQLEHVAFGTMMDKGGKPFKTRDGGTVKLIDLLEESKLRAKDAITFKDNYEAQELEKLSEIVGIGAVKFADLSINRESNYIFDWDKMLSLEGNTSLYQQYAYARIMSILRKNDLELNFEVKIGDALEHRLVVQLLQFEETLAKAASDTMPHQICNYLFALTTNFMRFYELNPILRSDIDQNVQQSRLAIALLSAKIIQQGLKLLGIEVPQKL